jgi:hypothetical protein
MNNINDLALLQRAILAIHGCHSEHAWTASVKEAREGRIVWDGKVEVFTLTAHPTATEAFAWNYRTDDDRMQSVAVLKVPPIETPSDAVRAAIASGKIK